MNYIICNQKVNLKLPQNYNAIDFLKIIEECGRTCYKSEHLITEESYNKFIQMIINNGHESVLEHYSITANIITNRAIANEIVRHRLASYSQESTRYCNYDKNEVSFIHNKNWKNVQEVETMIEECVNTYKYLVEIEKTKPEHARDILPLCLKTELNMTCNIRQWRHFLKMRGNKKAHPQIRELCYLLKKEFNLIGLDILFNDIEIEV